LIMKVLLILFLIGICILILLCFRDLPHAALTPWESGTRTWNLLGRFASLDGWATRALLFRLAASVNRLPCLGVLRSELR
jgi:hypothetical protein